MRIKITSILAAGLLSLPLIALAADAMPKMGSSKDTVRSQFGAPMKQIPGVGTPSISRWEYQEFTVYFEDGRALHSVRHATALAQPPANAPAQQPIDTLPPIEEINDEVGSAPAPATPAAATPAEQPTGETESTFRFDPVSGRIIEVGADGKALPSPTAQPAAQTAPLEAEAPAEALEADTKAASEDLNKEKAAAAAAAAAAASEAKPAVKAPAAPTAPAPTAPAPAIPAAPAAETGQPQFRFDPVSGRIVVDDPAAAKTAPEQPKAAPPKAEAAPEAKAAPSEATEQPAPAPAQDSKPEAQPQAEKKTEKKKAESGGFSVDWGA